MACSAALLLACTQRAERLDYFTDGGTRGFLSAVSSNPNYAAYLTAALHSEQNSLQPGRLEWNSRPAPRTQPGPLRTPAATNTIQ